MEGARPRFAVCVRFRKLKWDKSLFHIQVAPLITAAALSQTEMLLKHHVCLSNP